MNTGKRQKLLGWCALVLSTCISTFWAFWGIIENFHEGWHRETLPENLGLLIAQYLSPMLIFLALSFVAVRWPRTGSVFHLAAAGFMLWFFKLYTSTVAFFIVGPMLLLAVLYWFGRAEPRKYAYTLLFGLPLLALIVFGTEPAWRVAQRIDDGIRTARTVEGNGLTLVWAPRGPGWPESGYTWDDARRTCRHLTEDGLSLADTIVDIWRLPSVDEAVRSMARHGVNSGGVWNADKAQASYDVRPDKESPLWDTRSQVIYWWTDTEVDDTEAYMIVYDGNVWPKRKDIRLTYFAFRAVKDPVNK